MRFTNIRIKTKKETITIFLLIVEIYIWNRWILSFKSFRILNYSLNLQLLCSCCDAKESFEWTKLGMIKRIATFSWINVIGVWVTQIKILPRNEWKNEKEMRKDEKSWDNMRKYEKRGKNLKQMSYFLAKKNIPCQFLEKNLPKILQGRNSKSYENAVKNISSEIIIFELPEECNQECE